LSVEDYRRFWLILFGYAKIKPSARRNCNIPKSEVGKIGKIIWNDRAVYIRTDFFEGFEDKEIGWAIFWEDLDFP